MKNVALNKLSFVLCFDIAQLIREFADYNIHPCSVQINNLECIIEKINPCLIHHITMQRISFMYNKSVYTIISDWYNYYDHNEITFIEMLEYAEKDHLIQNAGHMILSPLLFSELEEWIYFESLVLRGIIHKNESFRSFNISEEIDLYYENTSNNLSSVEKFVFRWIYFIEPLLLFQ